MTWSVRFVNLAESSSICGWLESVWSLLFLGCPDVKLNHCVLFDVGSLKEPIWLNIHRVYLPF